MHWPGCLVRAKRYIWVSAASSSAAAPSPIDDGHGVDPPDVLAGARDRHVDRRHAEEHLPRRHQVDPEQVDERLHGALALAQQRVAPVLVREPGEGVDPVAGQPHRPDEDHADDQPAPDVVEPERPGRPPVDRQQRWQHAPPGVVEAGVVVGSAEPEDHQGRERVGDQAVQPEMGGVRTEPQPGGTDRDRDQRRRCPRAPARRSCSWADRSELLEHVLVFRMSQAGQVAHPPRAAPMSPCGRRSLHCHDRSLHEAPDSRDSGG